MKFKKKKLKIEFEYNDKYVYIRVHETESFQQRPIFNISSFHIILFYDFLKNYSTSRKNNAFKV